MGINDSVVSIDNINERFVNKYSDYIDLMKIAGCSEEEIKDKQRIVFLFGFLGDEQKNKIISNDLNFLRFFSTGGIEDKDSDISLFKGINEQIAKSIVCTMSSISDETVFTDEMEKELNEPTTLMKVKDMVSKDMSDIFPDIKSLFFNGNYKEFNNRMKKIYSEDEIQSLSDIVDSSVYNKDESGVYQYIDLIERALIKTKEIDYNKKNIAL